jgi:hypothetical protein
MAFYKEDAVFWTGIATMTFAFLGLIIKSCLTSKCDNVNICCGMIQIHRAVELEKELELETIKPEETKDNTV